MAEDAERLDHKIIYGIVEPDSRVLDLGCGEGDLLYLLSKGKGIKAQGIELREDAIYKCVEKGLSVFHGDIDSGLTEYPDKSFDYVILNQSMQEVRKVDFVIDEALRIGDKVIVGFPNFAYWRARLRLFLKGKTPVTYSLPYRWYNTPNLHFLSISDFKEFCSEKGISIIEEYYLGKRSAANFLPNLFALNAVYVITKR
ncbi:MAG: methionine biosynthesis protein MetW [Omnitrophica WOR_2 bacterium RIFCSPLOWO2_12_FULL_51_24]|nr:MAG: methionine biosynthesis protein MetW [Omnitrophica WOR_2 bacterium RIFCSPHIGHO2_01_FULL_49_10]OGX32535.1 MAG: methionine biosynthesis protein MetW [Omnitrophica WOR_2 bacterium RIFCSPLOWO2_02_FULL_50_19]OGX43268.1 MAG: methionine biosynthesis protein MetW [Omnitrophica WOR_2 bacterium RIFCSPLOWO2_12_FULL_51_24]